VNLAARNRCITSGEGTGFVIPQVPHRFDAFFEAPHPFRWVDANSEELVWIIAAESSSGDTPTVR
jgi:hypothetical protein